MPLAVAVSGFKNTGKTTLALALLEEILSAGLSAGFVKHTEKDVLSREESDTGRAVSLGIPCVYCGNDGAVFEAPGAGVTPERLDVFFPGKDIVIVEGAKRTPMPRIWVGDPGSCPPGVKGVFAYYDRSAAAGDGKKFFAEGDEKMLAGKVIELYRRGEGGVKASLFVGGKKIPLKAFVSEMIAGCLSGLVLPLKGVHSLKDGVQIYLKRNK